MYFFYPEKMNDILINQCLNHAALGTYGSDAEKHFTTYFKQLSDHIKLNGTTFRPKIKHVLRQFSSGGLYLLLFM